MDAGEVLSFASARLPLKAEDLSPSEVIEVASKTPSATLIHVLIDRLECNDPLLNPTVLVGPKGSGKTLAAISAAISLSKPIRYYIYRDPHRVEEISGRLGLNGGTPQAYVFDDIHYICEAVAGGFEDVKVLEDFVSKAISLAERGFPVIMVSEDLPHIYFEDLGVKSLASFSEYFTKLHLLLIEPLNFDNWVKIVKLYGIKGDEPGLSLTYALSPRPRFFMRLASEIGELTLNNIIRGAAERLNVKRRSALEEAVLQIPIEHAEKISKILNEIKSIEYYRSLFRRIASIVASEIRRRVDNPYIPGTHLYNKWMNNDLFLLKVYSEKFGFPYEQVHAAIESFYEYSGRLIPLFRDYIKYDYEEIRRSALIVVDEVESLSGFRRLNENYVFRPKIFLEAFGDLLETSTAEIVRKLTNRIWLNERWMALFRYFKKKRPNCSPEEIKNLRRTFLKNAPSGLTGRDWRKKIIMEALQQPNFIKPSNHL